MAFSNPITLGRPLTPSELADNFELSQSLHDAALVARDQAVSAAGIYATTGAGIAATTNGQYFCVPSVDVEIYLVLYRNNAGSALAVSIYPSAAAVDAAIAAAEAAAGVTDYATLTEISTHAGTNVLPVNDGTAKKTTLAKVLAWIVAQANTWTGRQTFGAGVVEKHAAVAASSIDLALASWFSKTISGATTFTLANVPASGNAVSFILELTNGGSAVVTWWAGVKWAGGTAPTLTASGRDVLGFFTRDGGTTWTGLVLGADVK